MSFLSAFSTFLGSPLLKTFTSGFSPLLKGDLKADEYLSSIFDQVLKVAPQKVGEFAKFVAPYVANIDKVNETLKRAAKDLPSLQEFEPLKEKRVKTVMLAQPKTVLISKVPDPESLGWKPIDSGGPSNSLLEEPYDISVDILAGRKSLRDLPPLDPVVYKPQPMSLFERARFESNDTPTFRNSYEDDNTVYSQNIRQASMGMGMSIEPNDNFASINLFRPRFGMA